MWKHKSSHSKATTLTLAEDHLCISHHYHSTHFFQTTVSSLHVWTGRWIHEYAGLRKSECMYRFRNSWRVLCHWSYSKNNKTAKLKGKGWKGQIGEKIVGDGWRHKSREDEGNRGVVTRVFYESQLFSCLLTPMLHVLSPSPCRNNIGHYLYIVSVWHLPFFY